MSDKEKLIEILSTPIFPHNAVDSVEAVADYLIDSGVVPVVRCKDCVYAREMDKYEKLLYLSECVGCVKHSKSYSSVVMMENDYCSYGERKE